MSINVETRHDGRRVCPIDHHSVDYGQNFREINREIREAGPVVWSNQHGGFWYVTDYDSVRSALLDAETFTVNPVEGTDQFGVVIPQLEEMHVFPETPGFFSFVDGERHDVPKAVLSGHFSKRRLATKAEMISSHVDRVLDTVLPRGEFDIVRDAATPVVAGVVCELLGLDLDDPSAILGVLPGPPGQVARQDEAEGSEAVPMSLAEGLAFIGEFVQARQEEPRDDLISLMLQANGGQFSAEEVAGMCLQILFGALENPQSLVGSCMLYLEDRPETRAHLRDNPSEMPAFIAESMRYFNVTVTVSRTAARDVELGGAQIRKGERVLISQSAANTDPAVFDRPDEFDFQRGPRAQHLSLGAGAHACLGASLVQATVETLLRGLLERIEEYSFDLDHVTKIADKASNDLFEEARMRVTALRAPNAHGSMHEDSRTSRAATGL